MKSNLKKVLAGILALCMVVGGIYYVAPEAKEVQAEATEETEEHISYTTEEYTEDESGTVQGYLTNKTVIESNDNPGWLFAGWFTDEYCTTPVTTAVEGTTYHAKFVDPGVLNVKLQITDGTEDGSPSTNMRLVTSVDSLSYAEVGFEVYYGEEDIENKTVTQKVPIQKVFKRIVASSTSGVDYNYSPKVVDTDSEYFATATLINIANGNFEKPFYIKPYWITNGGATVYGTSRYVTIQDDALSTSTTVNVPVKIADADTYTVTNAGDTTNTQITNTEAYHDGDYAHLRIAKTDVPSSLTKLSVSNDKGSGTAFYRNLNTVYSQSGTAYDAKGADKTWYTAYADSEGVVSETEFIIATTADLYALPTLVNTDGVLFEGKTIYIVSDIQANSGYTIVGDEVTQPAMKGGTGYRWEAVGTVATSGSDENAVTIKRPFSGTFDGCGHTISGLNINAKPSYCGFFGATNKANICNFNLIESVFKTSVGSDSSATDFTGGIVAYGNANLSNIYCDADINSYNQLGGLIGRVDYFADYDTSAVKVEIENCHYTGIVYARSTGDKVRSGGIIGYAVRGDIDITNTMFSGTIRVSAGADRIGGFIGDSNDYATSDICISNSVSAGNIKLIDSNTSSTRIGSLIGRLYGTKTVCLDNVYATKECYNNVYDATTDSSSSFRSGGENPIQIEKNENLIGLKAYHWTNLDFIKDWSIRKNQLITPRKLANSDYRITEDNIKADTSWYTAEEGKTEYEIADAADLYGLAILVNSGNTFEGIKIKLTADIDLNPEQDAKFEVINSVIKEMQELVNEWIPIGTESNPFKGSFDGNNKTIRGLYIDKSVNDGENAGLFGYIDAAVIRDVGLVDGYIHVSGIRSVTGEATKDSATGSVIGRGYGTLEGVYSNVGIYAVNSARIGGLVGVADNVNAIKSNSISLNNCWYDGDIAIRVSKANAAEVYAGGLIGYVLRGTSTMISNTLFNGQIDYKNVGAYSEATIVNVGIGGFIGRDNETLTKITISDSIMAGDMIIQVNASEYVTNNYVASILGRCSGTLVIEAGSAVYSMNNTYGAVVLKDTTSSTNVDTITKNVVVIVDWDGAIGSLNSEYWAPTTTIPVLRTLTRYTNYQVLP